MRDDQRVTIELDGVEHESRYRTGSGSITVSAGGYDKTGRLGNMPVTALASTLLRELVREEAARNAQGE